MADNSNNNQNLRNEKLNGNANNTLPSFNHGISNDNNHKSVISSKNDVPSIENNKSSDNGDVQNDSKDSKTKNIKNSNPTNIKNKAKKTVLKEGIKKGAAAYGVPEAATDAILNTETGNEALNVASNASSLSEGTINAVKVIVTKSLIKYLPLLFLPLLLIMIIFVLLFGRSAFSDFSVFDSLEEEIKDVASKYSYRADIDETLILATLIGYNLEGESSIDIDYLKSKVEMLVKYQLITNTACEYDSSNIRKIASNDDWLNGEANYNCVSDMEGQTYTLSIEQGNYDDDNSGSAYYWNLIDEGFIFDFYNEYMINKDDNTSENIKKIDEIIDSIYEYYYVLLGDEATNISLNNYNNDSFWWPIGSMEEVVVGGKRLASGEPALTGLSSNYGWRNIDGNRSFHGGIDIPSGGVVNYYNVIAAKSGVVVYPTSYSQTQYNDHSGNAYGNNDGGGYGNYVKIDHGNGEYTLYAHMAKGSITVMAGDVVEQGQIIGKVGHTGNSTGPHLHFEVYSGGSSSSFRVDPLQYVSVTEPRPSANKLNEWIKTIEGGTSGSYVNGDNYVVYATNDGSLEVGYGIVMVDKNGNQLHTDIYNTPVQNGSLIPMDIVDQIFESIVSHTKALLNSYIANNNITVTSNQYDALLSLMIDCGDDAGEKVVNAYGSRKDIDSLWQVMSSYSKITVDGRSQENYLSKLRRAEEYELFINGDYNYDPLSYIDGQPIKYYDVQNW